MRVRLAATLGLAGSVLIGRRRQSSSVGLATASVAAFVSGIVVAVGGSVASPAAAQPQHRLLVHSAPLAIRASRHTPPAARHRAAPFPRTMTSAARYRPETHRLSSDLSISAGPVGARDHGLVVKRPHESPIQTLQRCLSGGLVVNAQYVGCR
jgi:hypothetical protein